MPAAVPVTSAATPTTCPICSFDMSLLQAIQVETHMICHLAVATLVRSTGMKADGSADW